MSERRLQRRLDKDQNAYELTNWMDHNDALLELSASPVYNEDWHAKKTQTSKLFHPRTDWLKKIYLKVSYWARFNPRTIIGGEHLRTSDMLCEMYEKDETNVTNNNKDKNGWDWILFSTGLSIWLYSDHFQFNLEVLNWIKEVNSQK